MNTRPAVELQRLIWADQELGDIALPKGRLTIRASFGSGLSTRAGDPPGQVWATSDRGPNLKIETMVERYGAEHLRGHEDLAGAKVMPRTDIGPTIARLQVRGDHVEIVKTLRVRTQAGAAVSGLPMAGSAHADSEPALDLDGKRLAPDPAGLDPEGIVALRDGTFVLSEEFGPSLVRLDNAGQVLGRFVPSGFPHDDAPYPVHPVLPPIAGRRQLNRGFEAVASSHDETSLFVAFQSPLAHPDEKTHKAARHVRLWRLNAVSFEVVEQYLYLLDAPDTFARDLAEGSVERGDLKVSEMVCLPGGDMLVLERASKTTKIYRVTLSIPLPREHLDVATRPSVEELSAAGAPLPSLEKTLLFSSDDLPELSPDMEGMAVLSPTELLLVNDNDFGVEGAETAFWRVRLAEPLF